MNIISLFTGTIFLILGTQLALSQEVISQIEIQRGANNHSSDYMVRDGQGNYYVGLDFATSRDSLMVGGQSVKSHRNDPIFNGLSLSDFYFLRFDQDHILTGGFVIDNAEDVNDFYSSGDHSFLAMNLYEENGPEDTLYPITIGGEIIIDREANRGKGVLVILDENLNLQKAIIPASCVIGEVAAEEDYVYMELRIPDYEPYITIGQDTVYNQTYTGMPDDYGRQTVVLCKYDYKNEEVVWLLRIGNVGYEELYGMEIDHDHNLIIRGTTTSTNFTFDGVNFVQNNSSHNPFIGKYTAQGEYIVGIINPNEVNDFVSELTMDESGNFYRIGNYYGSMFEIGDTTLLSPWLGSRYADRGIVVKYDAEGNFKWILQLEGAFESSSLHSIALDKHNNVIVSGLFFNGEMTIGGQTYYHDQPSGRENGFLWVIDKETGKYKNHVMTEGENHRRFYNMSFDQSGLLNLFLRFGGNDTIFNDAFSSNMGFTSGFLVKLNMNLITGLFDASAPFTNYTVYPNPVPQGDNIWIYSDQFSFNINCHYGIFDQNGKLLITSVATSENHRIKISTKELSPGSYSLIAKVNEQVIVKLIIVV